ncbi:MAG: carbon starvation protein A [bacterium]
MNIGLILLISIAIGVAGYKFYARFIARQFEENDGNPTPAKAMEDGVDYVPTRPTILFSHHFATIAGAGPIVGPTLALVYGFLPAWAWIVVGSVFFGAVHDYTALFASLREKGRSVAEITGKTTGKLGFFLYIAFTILLILLVTSAFLDLTVVSLTSIVDGKYFGNAEGTALFPLHKTMVDGAEMVRIGGIATTSVIIITLIAPIVGFIVYRRGIKTWAAVAIALCVSLGSILVGMQLPVVIGDGTYEHIKLPWMLILTVYTFVAAGIPVWIVLQPRDFINSFILYTGVAVLLIAGLAGGVMGITADPELFKLGDNVAKGTALLGPIWPILFITIACGAISGFHSLVAGGTTAKQCATESDAKRIAYGGMLLEGLLATGVIIALAAGLGHGGYMANMYPEAGKGNPILTFALGFGGLANKALGIPLYLATIFGILAVEGFIVTTLDSAVRLNRYLFEELWRFIWKTPPALLMNYMFNAGLSVGLMFLLAVNNGYKIIWPVFGTANQMMAALALIAISIWLVNRKKTAWYTLIPAVFMTATTLYSLIYQLQGLFKKAPADLVQRNVLAVTIVLLILFSVGVIIVGATRLIQLGSHKPGGPKLETAR